jgi:hypothetical protein
MSIPQIAYIYYSHIGLGPGVEKAIVGKAQAVATIAPGSIDFYALTPVREGYFNQINYVKLQRRSLLPFYYQHLFQRYYFIEKFVDLEQYEYLILRYPRADRSGPLLMNRQAVVTEHHTDELSELLTAVRNASSPSIKAVQAMRYFLERRYAPPILQRCRGLITVTDEIRQVQLARAGQKLPAAVIPNGIDVAAVPQTGFRPFDGKTLDMVMVAGAPSPWHGIERVLAGLNRYNGTVQIRLHLVGGFDRGALQKMGYSLHNVRFHGFKRGQALDEIMSQMHLALSTLALHQKQMREASSLKTREYTARGIPFVLAYDDPDLLAVPADRRFYLSLPNDDTAVDMGKVLDFVERMNREGEDVSIYMRQYATGHMDWQAKMRQYLDFINLIHNENKATSNAS